MNLDDICRIAGAQAGMFTTRQAELLGIGRKGLREAVRSGGVLHPARGLYAVTALVDTGSVAWQHHLAAGARLLYPDATLTGVTAVLAHGLPVWGCRLDRPDLLRPIERQAGAKPYRVRPLRSTTVEGPWGRSVPLAEALVQLCMDHGIVQGVVSADAALHRGLVSKAELEAAVDAVATWSRSHRPRAMITHVDPMAESVAESRARVEFSSHGIQVESQFVVRRGDGTVIGRADFRVKGTNVLVEVDGKIKYADGDPQVLWAEKRREDDMRAEGWIFVRVTWFDLETPGKPSAKVHRAMLTESA
ncbi:type IV toxin-antitoxin system AbiEi family antitoxin domain-containing protein [Knoellia locipacati]|uniref:type IV toxin-antitoxin system AbiEi family antitoxin domain-containing protein n=1 Tax=Knoellia locipacati TaxID=882824 RepID=UPI00384F716E